MRVNGIPYRTVWMEGDVVKMIDQHRLPDQFAIHECAASHETAEAIRTMRVRGAGAIGVAAGYAMAQAALCAPSEGFEDAMAAAAALVRGTRPTARTLFYAVERVLDGVSAVSDVEQKRRHAVAIAQAIADEDAAAAQQIGRLGAELLPSPCAVLTHCNAGWLAFTDWGTALAPIYWAHRHGRRIAVFATETRPRAQGAKLTAWELTQEGVPCTVIPDTAAGHLMQQGLVQLVIVGADRIAANGDVANKIGTYGLAVLARAHGIPFYVAAPTTTIDLACPEGRAIPIEERGEDEVRWTAGVTSAGEPACVRTVPVGCMVRNWAFDVTPAGYVTGLITERGLIPPEPRAIRTLMERHEIPLESSAR
jgi:methylthioribose-1-phosphate isomerase